MVRRVNRTAVRYLGTPPLSINAPGMLKYFSIVLLVLTSLLPASAQDRTATDRFQDEDVTASAQYDGAVALEEIRMALSLGDVERLVERLGPRIDLTLFGTNELLSRSQARYVVKSFFAEYPPIAVDLIDTTESDGNWFASAGYWYETGTAPMSVYLRLRLGSAGWELRELRFDRSSAR